MNFSNPKYDKPLHWIHEQLEKGKNRSYLENPGYELNQTLSMFLDMNRVYHGWEINEDEWLSLVENEYRDAQKRKSFEIIPTESIIVSLGEDNGLKAPTTKYSSWQKYREVLKNKGFDKKTIDTIENDSEGILRKLSLDTTKSDPIKGLVVGSVQSGKTTNMAALMAMAADRSWNVFIVLTGMIDNLRKQTQDRLFTELVQTNGSVNWDIVENPSMDGSSPRIPQNMDFNSNQFIIVSLKNGSRLKGLLEWLASDPNKRKQMRILVIDDESDQASINTSDLTYEERRTINRLLVNLVNGKTHDGKELIPPYQALNYVGYTATPYANVLSESAEESLYPKDFIALLSQSPNYLGPTQIFGVDGEDNLTGLDIIREIDKVDPNEYNKISLIHQGKSSELPKALKESIAYFIASSASLRKHNFGRPVSMLVHTSVAKNHHDNVANSIVKWLREAPNEVLTIAESVWNREKERFTIDHFKEALPNYDSELSNTLVPHSFDIIKQEIIKIMNEIGPIKSPRKGSYLYHEGLHLCIDNSSYAKIIEEDEHYRLVYPDDANDLKNTPIFLVIGGATLSRGLTLEGLISTYFIRNSGQADSLMQMGRWFGYRIGYELYPRVWMSTNGIQQFEFLADLDNSLREEIIAHNALGRNPSEVGIKIKNSPKNVRLKVTARNKSRAAIESDFDFTGASIQTTIFQNNPDIMKYNLELFTRFIDDLGKPKIIDTKSQNSIYWEKIPFEKIKNFLTNYNFSERMRVGNNINEFVEWVEKVTKNQLLEDWNIIAIGKGEINSEENNWTQKYFSWNKIQRSRRKDDKTEDIRIQSLRAPSDMYKDIDLANIKDESIINIVKSGHTSNYLYIREKLGLEATPQLMLYRIDKNSKANENSLNREDLNTDHDLVGIYISIPGGRKSENYATHLVVDLESDVLNDVDLV